MWLLCANGWFATATDKHDKTIIHVCTCSEGALEDLCKAHGVKPAVIKTPYVKSPFRMDFKKTVWMRIMEEELTGPHEDDFSADGINGPPDFDKLGIWQHFRDENSFLWYENLVKRRIEDGNG